MSRFKSTQLVNILDFLNLIKRPFEGERVYINSLAQSVIITAVTPTGQVAAFQQVPSDHVNDEIDSIFPLHTSYDLTVKPAVTGYIAKFSNFKITRGGLEVKARVSIEGHPVITSYSLPIEHNTLVSIVVEHEKSLVLLERFIEIPTPLYIFASDKTSYSDLVLPGSGLPVEGHQLNIIKQLVTIEQGYLWVVSPIPVNYIRVESDIPMYLSGRIVHSDDLYYWRSDNSLNAGTLTLSIK